MTRFWGALLRPGAVLMQQLPLPVKLSLLAAAMVLPVLGLMAVAVKGGWQQRETARIERLGVLTMDRLVQLVVAVQDHRGYTLRTMAGDVGAASAQADARQALRDGVLAVDQWLAGLPDYSLADHWSPLRTKLLAVSEGRHADAPRPMFTEHSALVQSLRVLLQVNAERSRLVLDPNPVSFTALDLKLSGVMPLIDATATARGLGLPAMVPRHEGDATRLDVLAMAGTLKQAASELDFRMAALERAGGSPPGDWAQTQRQVQAYAQAVQARFASVEAAGDARGHFDQGTQVLDALGAMQSQLSTRLQGLLTARQQAYEAQLAWVLAGLTAALLAVSWLMASFTATFRGSVKALRQAADAIAQGDLSHRVQVRGRDEMAQIGGVMDTMADRLSHIVAEIRNSASMVNLTGQQVSEGSSRLATRTDEQAGSLRSSVSAIQQLTTAVALNAEAAQSLDTLTGQLARRAEAGNAAMQDTVQAMQQMRQASERVAEVVSVIDDVAFQTSMLSLNAAVEAARAGEAGKGFAVVASEVRQLAQRCAESAEEIRRLIGEAGSHVEASTTKLGHTSESLTQIVDGVREVSTRLRSISSSSAEQSAGLELVTSTVGNLDELTRNNAALVEESSTASSALVTRAQALREAVASMRLRQGSADEALALVQAAREHLQQVGTVQALQDFQAADGRFVDRDLHLFVIDRNGVFAAHGADPRLAHQDVSAREGLDRSWIERAWAAADHGGGWIASVEPHPLKGQRVAKESWVCSVADGALLLGCGIHRHDQDRIALDAKPRASAWSHRSEVGAQALAT